MHAYELQSSKKPPTEKTQLNFPSKVRPRACTAVCALLFIPRGQEVSGCTQQSLTSTGMLGFMLVLSRKRRLLKRWEIPRCKCRRLCGESEEAFHLKRMESRQGQICYTDRHFRRNKCTKTVKSRTKKTTDWNPRKAQEMTQQERRESKQAVT